MPRPSKRALYYSPISCVNTASSKQQRTNTNPDSNVDEPRSELSIPEPNQTIGIIDASKNLAMNYTIL
jgi:hypothetical protein